LVVVCLFGRGFSHNYTSDCPVVQMGIYNQFSISNNACFSQGKEGKIREGVRLHSQLDRGHLLNNN